MELHTGLRSAIIWQKTLSKVTGNLRVFPPRFRLPTSRRSLSPDSTVVIFSNQYIISGKPLAVFGSRFEAGDDHSSEQIGEKMEASA